MRVALSALSRFTYVSKIADVARALRERGHQPRVYLGFSEPRSLRLLKEREVDFEVLHRGLERDAGLVLPHRPRATSLFRDYFIPHARQTAPALSTRWRDWQPDAAVIHLRDFGAMAAAESLRVPTVSVGSSCSPHRHRPTTAPFGSGAADETHPGRLGLLWRMHDQFNARVDAWMNESVRVPVGLPARTATSTWHSPDAVVLGLPPALRVSRGQDPPYVHRVGTLRAGPWFPPDDAERRDLDRVRGLPRPIAFVSLGTSFHSPATEACVQALGGFDGSVVIAGMEVSQPRRIGRPFFSNVDAVLEQVDVVVTVGGGQSVTDALRHRVPVVGVPQQGEQREICQIVAALGAGALPCPRKWDPLTFARCVTELAQGGGAHQAAARLGDDIDACGGPDAAARTVEAVAAGRDSLP